MHKVEFSNHRFYIISLLALLPIVFGLFSLTLMGEAMTSLAKDSIPLSYVLYLMMAYGTIQIVNALINTFLDNIVRYYSIDSFYDNWNKFFPLHINQEHRLNSSSFFNNLYSHIPKIFDLKSSIYINITSFFVICAGYLYRVWQDEYYIGLIYLPILILTTWLASQLYKNRYGDGIEVVSKQKSTLLNWINAFFNGYREAALNIGTNRLKDMYVEVGGQTHRVLKSHAKTAFLRDVFGGFLVDWPYIILISMTIIATAMGHLSFTSAVVWLGLVDYIVRANNSLRVVFSNQLQIKHLEKSCVEQLAWIGQVQTPRANVDVSNTAFSFTLQDESHVAFSLTPGIHRICGTNGSGKSTLLNALSGFSELITPEECSEVYRFRQCTNGDIRVITKDPSLYPNLSSFFQQIHLTDRNTLPDFGHASAILSNDIWEDWMSRLQTLSERFEARGTSSLSSGELVQLSFFRAMSAWKPGVQVLMVDECESWLDIETRKLFFQTIDQLSTHVSVLFVSHTMKESLSKSVNTNVNLLAFNQSQKGFLLNMSVTAYPNGYGKIETSGPIAKRFENTFVMVKRALIHCYPELTLLEKCGFSLSCREDQNIEILQSGSSGLAFAVAIVNIVREFQDRSDESYHGAAATGYILLDGTVESVRGIDIKRQIAQDNKVKYLFTPDDITHLADLKEKLRKKT